MTEASCRFYTNTIRNEATHMKKTMIRILLTVIVCTLAVTSAFAEAGPQYETVDGIQILTGYKSIDPAIYDGEGTPAESQEAPVRWIIPTGWAELVDQKPDYLKVAANYQPEQENEYGISLMFVAVDLSNSGREAIDKAIAELNVPVDEMDNTYLENETFVEFFGISPDNKTWEKHGENDFLVYSSSFDADWGDGVIVRNTVTNALLLRKGILYEFMISGTRENNDFYPSFEKLLDSIEFTD